MYRYNKMSHLLPKGKVNTCGIFSTPILVVNYVEILLNNLIFEFYNTLILIIFVLTMVESLENNQRTLKNSFLPCQFQDVSTL